jgi:hypothetical protein
VLGSIGEWIGGIAIAIVVWGVVLYMVLALVSKIRFAHRCQSSCERCHRNLKWTGSQFSPVCGHCQHEQSWADG